MTIRAVLVKWLDRAGGPDVLRLMDPDDKREFCTDICLAEPEWTFDWLGDGFTQLPLKRMEFEQALGQGDFLAAGAIADQVRRFYILEHCAGHWEIEFQLVWEQESDYEAD